MNIEVPCGQCGRRFQLDESLGGRKIKCKSCGCVIAVPNGTGSGETAKAAVLKSFDEPSAPRANHQPAPSPRIEPKPAVSAPQRTAPAAAPLSTLDTFDDEELYDEEDSEDSKSQPSVADSRPFHSRTPAPRSSNASAGRRRIADAQEARSFWTPWKIAGVAGGVVFLGIASVATTLALFSFGSVVAKQGANEPLSHNPNDSTIPQTGRAQEDTPLGKSVKDQPIERPAAGPESVAQNNPSANPPAQGRPDDSAVAAHSESSPVNQQPKIQGIRETNAGFEEFNPLDDANRTFAMTKIRDIVSKHGLAKTLSIEISEVPDVAAYKALSRTIRRMIRPAPKDRYTQFVEHHMMIIVGPVKDPAGLASKFDFGTIKKSKDGQFSMVFKGLSAEALALANEEPQADSAADDAEDADEEEESDGKGKSVRKDKNEKVYLVDDNGMPIIDAMYETNEGFQKFNPLDDRMKTFAMAHMVDISTKYGSKHTLTLVVKGIPDLETYQAISLEIQRMIKPKARDRFSEFVDDSMSITLGPVKNPDKIIAKIDFGIVKKSGEGHVEVEFKELKPHAPDPEPEKKANVKTGKSKLKTKK